MTRKILPYRAYRAIRAIREGSFSPASEAGTEHAQPVELQPRKGEIVDHHDGNQRRKKQGVHPERGASQFLRQLAEPKDPDQQRVHRAESEREKQELAQKTQRCRRYRVKMRAQDGGITQKQVKERGFAVGAQQQRKPRGDRPGHPGPALAALAQHRQKQRRGDDGAAIGGDWDQPARRHDDGAQRGKERAEGDVQARFTALFPHRLSAPAAAAASSSCRRRGSPRAGTWAARTTRPLRSAA